MPGLPMYEPRRVNPFCVSLLRCFGRAPALEFRCSRLVCRQIASEFLPRKLRSGADTGKYMYTDIYRYIDIDIDIDIYIYLSIYVCMYLSIYLSIHL